MKKSKKKKKENERKKSVGIKEGKERGNKKDSLRKGKRKMKEEE